ncbi:MAG: AAA family ATPase [bacterium]
MAKIKEILDRDFIFTEEVSRIFELAFGAGKNMIVFGPGGHAKSEMTKAVIQGLGIETETFCQFFGEGMDESRLFGGLDFRKLEEEKVLQYFPEKSFLNYRIAVFEELFDAPASVLLALKDTLTARELRNGAQRFPMRTEIIICLTNKQPSEISELGPAAHALIERFPLQYNLEWKDYSSKSYLKLFEKVSSRLGGPVLNGFKAVLAEVLAKATTEGNFVSPRTAVHAYQVCQTSAKLRGAEHVGQEDLVDLRYLPGLEGLAQTIEADLKSAMERAEAEKNLQGAEQEFYQFQNEVNQETSPIKILQAVKRLGVLQDKLAGMRVPDGLTDKRNKMRESVSGLITFGQVKAIDSVRI